MPSLSAAYEQSDADCRRGPLGAGVFVAGVAAILGALILATTPIAAGLGEKAIQLRAGLLAGVGVPLLVAGVVTALPADRADRIRAALGILVALVAVLWFWRIYPEQWLGAGGATRLLTAGVVGLFALGSLMGLWSVLGTLATFRQRNDPTATVTLAVECQGETRTIELPEEEVERRDLSSIVSEAATTN